MEEEVSREFVLLARPSLEHKRLPEIEGPIGPMPDISLMAYADPPYGFAGNYIPDYAKNMHFIFDKYRNIYPRKNIYMYFDFWLVSDAQKERLEQAANASFEFAPANTFDENKKRTDYQYWIAKVTYRVDCIDADASYVDREYPPHKKGRTSFSGEIFELELDDELAARFANYGERTYRTYPSLHVVGHLALKMSRIPADLRIFTPAYWPGYVLCDREFYTDVLIRDNGYTVWGIALPDVRKNYSETSIALR